MMLFERGSGEKHDVAQHHPEVVERLLAQAQAMRDWSWGIWACRAKANVQREGGADAHAF